MSCFLMRAAASIGQRSRLASSPARTAAGGWKEAAWELAAALGRAHNTPNPSAGPRGDGQQRAGALADGWFHVPRVPQRPRGRRGRHLRAAVRARPPAPALLPRALARPGARALPAVRRGVGGDGVDQVGAGACRRDDRDARWQRAPACTACTDSLAGPARAAPRRHASRTRTHGCCVRRPGGRPGGDAGVGQPGAAGVRRSRAGRRWGGAARVLQAARGTAGQGVRWAGSGGARRRRARVPRHPAGGDGR
mmetsp:Transcript_39163/g.96806  ORF Transcript_39163/g.96806 Transcript_39163/m.96806 type:complete len:251 (-) Transcript_39163:636-1388(-)